VSPVITTVVTDVPTETDAGAPLVTINYPDPGADVPSGDELQLGHGIMPHVVVNVAATPSLGAQGGILEMWEQQDQWEAAVQQAHIVGAPLLAQLAARGAGRSINGARELKEHQVKLDDVSSCDEPDYCGRAEELTPRLWRVVTSFSCGDGCYTGWRLFDPLHEELIEGDWAGQISDAWLAPDASAFVSAGRVYRLDSGPLDATPAIEDGNGIGGGWLGGGTYLP
jgi:hypothetical protein